MRARTFHSRKATPALEPELHPRERGQAAIQMVLMLSIFLLPMLGFAIDLTNMWVHRQQLQTAADAACQAGAMDLYANYSGVTASNSSFTTFVGGNASNCASLPGASLCKYASFNGYNGSGFSSSSVSNSVSWTFPTSVTGVTAPSASHPFLAVTIEENVKTWFLGLMGRKYQAVAATCTCGMASTAGTAPPMVVLDPTDSGTLTFGGGAVIKLVGGSSTSIQVNSTSATAVVCNPSGEIDLSQAGPNDTGATLGIVGGPTENPTCWGSAYNNLALNPGTTGAWTSPSPAVSDPFASVATPTIPATSLTGTNTNAEIVTYGQDGCPDHSPTNYVSTTPHSGCIMLEPGYYPSGASFSGNDVVIFKPGFYYFNGNLSIGGSDDIRPATPCKPSCSPYSTTTWQQTDGVIFYFSSGQFTVSGGAGALSSSRVDAYTVTGLTCDGSSPASSLSVPTTINGNVLVAQCTQNGTYWDTAGDTSDSRGSPGTRGILVFQGHSNQATATTFSGSGALAFSGSMYFHDKTSGSPSTFSVNGGSGTTSYVIGSIIADEVNLSGSGKINMQLNTSGSSGAIKVGTFF